MKPIRQLLRQPIKTLSGIILVALAVATLCVCVGQATVASNMQNNLEEICSSYALLTQESLQPGQNHTGEEVLDWLYEIAREYPDIVEGINSPGLASAYIPALTGDQYTAHFYPMNLENPRIAQTGMSTDKDRNNQTHVMLEINLEEIGEISPALYGDVSAVSVELTGTVVSVLGLQEGYNDPIGYTARMTLVMPDPQAVEALALEVGQRYLVYGMDYTDLDWQLRMNVAEYGHGLSAETAYDPPRIEYFDPENMVYFPEDYIEKMGWKELEEYNIGYYEHMQTLDNGKQILRGVHLTNLDMLKYRSVRFTLADLHALDETVPETYETPTIVRLDGTAEEFLSGEEGALWQRYLEYTQINNHSFPVMGVDDLMVTGSFATQETVITAGRQFTQEETQTGAKVCVISEELAQYSGVTVGDTITLHYYSIDRQDPHQQFVSDGEGTVNPMAYRYGPGTEMAEGEAYTVVGIYDKNPAWEGAASLYDFRVNTVFAPKTAVSGEMDYADSGVFLSVALRNGEAEAFTAIALRDGMSEMFRIGDQNYDSMKTNLHDYQQMARNARIIGVVIYSILLALFLVFYPAMQRQTLSTMGKIGANGFAMLRFMTVNSLGILIPGTAAGLGLTTVLWDRIVGFLTDASRTTLDLALDPGVVLAIAGAQLALALVPVLAVSGFMIGRNDLMNRPGLRIVIPGLKNLPMAKIGAAVFAAVVALSLCTLHRSSEAERENYEKAYADAEVSVALLNLNTGDPYALNASNLVKELVYENRFPFSLRDYLTDEKYMNSMKVWAVNEELYEQTIWGMNSNAEPEELSAKWDAEITWFDGYDESCLDSYSDMYLLVPEHLVPADRDPDTPGIQVCLWFQDWNYYTNRWGQRYFYEGWATVAGTYTNKIDSPTIFCSIEPLFFCGNRVRMTLPLMHFSAVIKDNSQMDALKEEAAQYFTLPGQEQNLSVYAPEVEFQIYSDALERMQITLENSIRFNELCTVIVFVLSAGAGFFLGFLMIRSRKREIILMRTLGRANFGIYVSYALEQMLCIAAGAALGGMAFQWQPMDRLGIFLGVYFVGLSAALILFLNSKLLTNIKEDA